MSDPGEIRGPDADHERAGELDRVQAALRHRGHRRHGHRGARHTRRELP